MDLKDLKGQRINMRDLAKELCAREGGRIEVNIAQVEDVISKLCDIIHDGHVGDESVTPFGVLAVLVMNGDRRAKTRVRKKK
jgi:hypothetical protein